MGPNFAWSAVASSPIFPSVGTGIAAALGLGAGRVAAAALPDGDPDGAGECPVVAAPDDAGEAEAEAVAAADASGDAGADALDEVDGAGERLASEATGTGVGAGAAGSKPIGLVRIVM